MISSSDLVSHRSVIRGDLAFLGHLPLAADIFDIAMEGDLACLAGFAPPYDNSVYVVDLTDPLAPALRSQIPVSWQPAATVLVGSYETAVPVGGLAVHDEAIYVAATDGGGLILLNDLQTVGIGGQGQQEPGATPLLAADALHCWPNPLNPGTTFGFSLPRADRVRLEVVDLRGRLVARLIDGELAAGQHAVDWDGRDLAGRRLASGNYLGRLVSERMVSAAKIMVVK